MTTPSPICTVNSASPPQDVAANSTVTGGLASAAGADFWSLTVIGCDEQNTVAAIQATLVVNQASKTFSFTAPSALGSAVTLQSMVGQLGGGLGRDVNNRPQASFTTTFKVNVLSSAGTRVLAINEELEQDPIFGWLRVVNGVLRAGGGSSGVSAGGAITPNTLTWGAGATSPTLQQTAAASGAGQNMTIAPQAATTTGASGDLIVNVGAPASGSTEAGLVVERAGSPLAYIGSPNGVGGSIQISLGYGTGANTGSYIQGVGTTLTLNGSGTTSISVGNTNYIFCNSNLVGFNQPIAGQTSGVPFKLGTSTVTFAATGTTTLSAAQQQTPLIVLSTVTLTGTATLDFGNVTGFFWVDVSGLTLGAQVLQFKNGTQTTSVASSPLVNGNKTLLTVSCTPNHMAIG